MEVNKELDSIYCGGRFYFDYLHEGYREKAYNDYRACFLNDVDLLLNNRGSIRLSDNAVYVGPFYFESESMIDRDIVREEMKQIEACTVAFFLLDDCNCPGTISEMVYAATLKKNMVIYYVSDEEETESTLLSSCWYPIKMCQILNNPFVEAIPCTDPGEAKKKILERLEQINRKESRQGRYKV